jgi:hypothetical protein
LGFKPKLVLQKTKSGVLFALIYGLAIMTVFFNTLGHDLVLREFFRERHIFGYYAPFSILIHAIWSYTTASKLINKLPDDVVINDLLFQITLVLNVVVAITYCLFLSDYFPQMQEMTSMNFWVLLMGLWFISSIIVSWFLAKLLVCVEAGKKVPSGYFVAELMLMFFFFVGVWAIQPRVNRLFSSKRKRDMDFGDVLDRF